MNRNDLPRTCLELGAKSFAQVQNKQTNKPLIPVLTESPSLWDGSAVVCVPDRLYEFKWDFGAVFFLLRDWGLASLWAVWRCLVVDRVMIQCRFYKAGSGASLVPSKAGFTLTTPPWEFMLLWSWESHQKSGHEPLLPVSLQTLTLAVAITVIKQLQHRGVQKGQKKSASHITKQFLMPK